ncbi:MAG: ribokinase [Mesorhizobium sp.]
MNERPKPAVVVVGSLHYDIMVDAPDRPMKGETVTGHAWRPKFGGKGGNQAVAAARSGAEVRMIGAVGDDDFGHFLLSRLADGGVDGSRVARLPEAASGMSVAISDAGGDYGAVIVSGANLLIDPHTVLDPALWAGAGVLILQNEVADALNVAAAQAARHCGAMVCLNAAPCRELPEALRSLVDVLIVNALEAEQSCGVEVVDLPSAAHAAETLCRTFPSVVVTAGGDGVAGCRHGQKAIQIPPLPVDLVSTHGAGDVFVGTLAAALAAGETLEAALKNANIAAARHVSTRQQ